MASSKTEIANDALILIGAETINDLDSDSTNEAITCKKVYDICRKSILRSHPWNCATVRRTLPPLTSTPDFTYGYQFTIPSDCLRLIKRESLNDDYSYRIENGKILTNLSSINLVYVKDVTDVSKFDALLSDLIAAYMAFKVSYKLTQSRSVRSDMYSLYKDLNRNAKTVNAQENEMETLDSDYFIEARLYSQSSASAIPMGE